MSEKIITMENGGHEKQPNPTELAQKLRLLVDVEGNIDESKLSTREREMLDNIVSKLLQKDRSEED